MANKEKILVVDDEPSIRKYLQTLLEVDGFAVEAVPSGKDALQKIGAGERPDFVILDVLMPEIDGLETLRQMMQLDRSLNVIMLSCSNEVTTVVEAIRLGALDYLTKPFAFEELLARLRAVKRRAAVPQATKLQVGNLVLDPATREVSRGGRDILLTRTEYNLLERLMYRVGKVVPRRSLIEAVWGFDRDIEENTLDAFVRLLRTKIDTEDQPKLIHTVRGVGYMIRAEVQP